MTYGVQKSYDAPCLTKITLDNWRCFGQVEVLSTAGALSPKISKKKFASDEKFIIFFSPSINLIRVVWC